MHRHADKKGLKTFEEYRYQGACNLVPGTLTHATASNPNSGSQIIVSTTAGPTGSCSNASIVDKESNPAAILLILVKSSWMHLQKLYQFQTVSHQFQLMILMLMLSVGLCILTTAILTSVLILVYEVMRMMMVMMKVMIT